MVFFSHNNADEADVKALAERLTEQFGLRSWIDSQDIRGGAAWESEIRSAIDASKACLVTFGPHGLGNYQKTEVRLALDRRVREPGYAVVPVLLPGGSWGTELDSDLQAFVMGTQQVVLSDLASDDEGFERIVAAVEKRAPAIASQLSIHAVRWAAQQWELSKRRDASLLFRGSRLQRAQEILVVHEYDALAAEFVAVSARAERQRTQRLVVGLTVALVMILAALVATAAARDEAVREATARATAESAARMEADVRATAESRAIAEAETRATAQAEAEQRRAEAERERGVALARQLAAQAELLLQQAPSFLPRALLLAAESLRRTPSLQGDLAVRRGLALHPRLVMRAEPWVASQTPVFNRDVSALAFSPDGRWLVSGGLDATLRVWDATDWSELLRVVPATSGGVLPAVRALAIAADSRTFVSGTDSGIVQVWDVGARHERGRFVVPGQTFSVAISPDGTWIAAAGGEAVVVWNQTSGAEVMAPAVDANAMAFSPDGQSLAAGGSGGAVYLWDVRTRRQLAEWQPRAPGGIDPPSIGSIAFAPDGRTLAAATGEPFGSFTYPRQPIPGALSVWDVATRDWLFHVDLEDAVYRLAYSSDGRKIVTGGFDGSARVWDAGTGRQRALFRHDSPVRVATFGHRDRWVVAGASDGTARVWEVATSRELARIPTELSTRISAVAVKPQTGQVAVGAESGVVWVWQLAGSESLAVEHDAAVTAVRSSPGRRWLLTAGLDKTARLWDGTTGEERVRVEHAAGVTSAVFSPDGHWVVSADLGGIVKITRVEDGRVVATAGGPGPVGTVAFSPDGKWLAVGHGAPPANGWHLRPVVPQGESTVKVLDTASWQVRLELPHEAAVSTLAFGPDGRWLATGSDDKRARVWDLSTGRPAAATEHEERVNLVAIHPSGELVASVESCAPQFGSGCEPSVRVWGSSDGRLAWTRQLPGLWVAEMAFSPDGSQLAAANSHVGGCSGSQVECENAVQVWDTHTGAERARLRHTAIVTSLAWSRDGRWIASAGGDRTVRVWDASNAREIARIEPGIEPWAIAFSGDSRSLYLGGVNQGGWGVAQAHTLDRTELLRAACSRLTRNLTSEEWHQYIALGEQTDTCTK